MNLLIKFILIALSITGYNWSLASTDLSEQDLLWQWFEAAKDGHLDVIKSLKDKIDVNAKNITGNTALIVACAYGYEDIVKYLLNIPGIDINAQNMEGYSPLISTAWNGRINIVKLLIQAPELDVNAQNDEGITALMGTALNGTTDIANLLLEIPGIDVNIGDKNGMTALMFACEDHPEVAKILLDAPGINVNAKDNMGHTALFFAETTDIIESLLKAGIDINAQTNYGQTALHSAASLDVKETVKILLEAPDIKINIRDKANKTAYNYAQEKEYFFISILIKNKVDQLTSQAFESISAYTQAFSDAEQQKYLGRLRDIIAQIGVDTVCDAEGNTLVDKAFQLNCPEIIEFLLQNANDPQELLARFPFEFMNPTVPTFKYFFDLAYQESSKINHKRKYDAASSANRCSLCSKSDCSKRCSVCKTVYYCSSECQKKHWKIHKHNCIKSCR